MSGSRRVEWVSFPVRECYRMDRKGTTKNLYGPYEDEGPGTGPTKESDFSKGVYKCTE